MAGSKDKTSLYFSEEEESEEEEDSEDDSDEGEDVPTREPRKDAVYNVAGLHEKLEEIAWPGNLDWMENLCINYKTEQEIDVNDDLTREMAFYTQALEGTRDAYDKLQALGVPFLRPPDYYAEMVKSDSHMLKVKDKLLFQKKMVEETEERKKARESKKLSKAIQAEKLKERAKQKKHDIESVKKWRKMRQDSGFTDGGKDKMPFDFGDGDGPIPLKRNIKRGVAPGDRSGGKSRHAAGKQSSAKGGGGGKGKPFDFGDGDGDGDGPIPLKRNIKRGVAPGDRSGGKSRHAAGMQSSAKGGGGGKGKGKRTREFKDAKFGHGGRKRLKKQNTAESAADFSGFGKGGDRGGKKKGRK